MRLQLRREANWTVMPDGSGTVTSTQDGGAVPLALTFVANHESDAAWLIMGLDLGAFAWEHSLAASLTLSRHGRPE